MTFYMFDESNEDVRNVKLTRQVDTFEYNGINLSLPTGVVRITAPAVINRMYTHIKTQYQKKNLVLHIDSISYVNTSVIDVAYTIDYVKSFFVTGKLGDLDGIIKTSNKEHSVSPQTGYNKYVKSNTVPLYSDITPELRTGTALDRNSGRWGVVCNASAQTFGKVAVYFITTAQLHELQADINLRREAQIVRSQILKIFWFPFFTQVQSSLTWIESNGIFVYTTYDHTSSDTLLDGNTCYELTTDFNSLYNIMVDVNSGITVNVNNYLDLSPFTQYTLYVPMVGSITIDPETLYSNVSGSVQFTPVITYRFDLITGSVCAHLKNQINTATTYCELPTYSLQVTEGAQGQFMVGYNTMTNFATGLLAGGGVGAAASAALTYISGSVQNSFAPMSGGNITSNSAIFRNTFELTILAHKPMISFNAYVSMYGYISNKLITTLTECYNEIVTVNVKHIYSNNVFFKDKLIDALNNAELKF